MPVLRVGHTTQLAWKLDRFWGLTWADRWRLLQTTLGLPINAAGVRLAGFRKWGAFLARVAGASGQRASGGLQTARQTWRVVQWAARYGKLYRARRRFCQ